VSNLLAISPEDKHVFFKPIIRPVSRITKQLEVPQRKILHQNLENLNFQTMRCSFLTTPLKTIPLALLDSYLQYASSKFSASVWFSPKSFKTSQRPDQPRRQQRTLTSWCDDRACLGAGASPLRHRDG
jgi:hypothetical protein